jgi:hypothetical protein
MIAALGHDTGHSAIEGNGLVYLADKFVYT